MSDEPRSSSAFDALVSELLGAVPEVRDHVIAAAEEMLGAAARAFLEAADRLLDRERRG